MEIGSEFNISLDGLKQVDDTVFNYLSEYNTIYTDSGRSAIRVACSQIKSKKILLPEYICDSVVKSFSDFEIEFYSLDSTLQIDIDVLETLLSPGKILFLMHYFGMGSGTQSTDILERIKLNKDRLGFYIIEDTTHSIFSQKQTIGDYCICSIRKWFPIPDGGICYSKHPISYEFLEMKPSPSAITKFYSMVLKDRFLQGDIKDCSEYRILANQAETHMGGGINISPISQISIYLLRCNSIVKMKEIRARNYDTLLTYLKELDIYVLHESKQVCCPFIMPIMVKKRNELRNYLIENKIYCAVHWPVENQYLGATRHAIQISNHILSLPIDQRYQAVHMKYLFDKIKDYIDDKI